MVGEFVVFDLGRCDDGFGVAEERIADEAVVNLLKRNVALFWFVHAEGLGDVGCGGSICGFRCRRDDEVVEAKEVGDVGVGDGGAQCIE